LWDLAESFSFFGPHFVHLQKGEYLQFWTQPHKLQWRKRGDQLSLPRRKEGSGDNVVFEWG
jgi:hypothetical protein